MSSVDYVGKYLISKCKQEPGAMVERFHDLIRKLLWSCMPYLCLRINLSWIASEFLVRIYFKLRPFHLVITLFVYESTLTSSHMCLFVAFQGAFQYHQRSANKHM